MHIIYQGMQKWATQLKFQLVIKDGLFMNDFTKEELHLIDNALVAYLTNAAPIEMEHLQEKVVGMIDSYCEHEYENSCCSCVDSIGCTKCDWILK